ncbi:sensor domain-containing diguanylate cyclase [Aliidiomarina haloalkalitolerans]|uniref:GGDEF domain-containing protein n=1 Tax=Aliidiomarina haloalkalitolerans TaxID=859059 RepID=A0A432VY41_9GAMM|nr:sensor domain-containing diguanylate cyclase [Aliidiomarina haloalkalitolerans]RUO21594.1 hypothetical protein CWE06_01695 [Aliidiomarina haloalkalitolerans]
MPRQAFKHYQNLLLRRAVIGMLVIGVVASLATLAPFYHQIQTYITDLNHAYADAQAQAISAEVRRYQDIGQQVSSRSEIRVQLEAYIQEQRSLDEIQAFTQPRLADAGKASADLIALVRFGRDGEIVAEHYFTSSEKLGDQFNEQLLRVSREHLDFIFLHTGQQLSPEQLLISVPSIIEASSGEGIGTDLLFFSAESLAKVAAEMNRFGEHMALYFVNSGQTHNFHLAYVNREGQRNDVIVNRDSELPFDRQILRSGVSSSVINWGSEEHSLFVVPLADESWKMVVSVPSYELYRSLYQSVLAVFAAILIAIILGTFAVRRTISPILNELTRSADQLVIKNQQLKLAGQVFENTHEAIVITDAELNILQVNRAFAHLLDVSVHALVNQNLKKLMVMDKISQQLERRIIRTLTTNDVWQGELWYRASDGRAIPALQTISTIRDANNKVTQLIHIFNDITEQKDSENRIKRKVITDGLTGLANREGLLQTLEAAVAKAKADEVELALIFMDLDNFKPVNDSHGHQVGDILLKLVAQRLLGLVRKNDMVARLGGDEFVIVLQGKDVESRALELAAALVTKLQQPFRLNDILVTVGASVGVALYPRHAENYKDLLNHADLAMYQAKQTGRNRYCVAEK